MTDNELRVLADEGVYASVRTDCLPSVVDAILERARANGLDGGSELHTNSSNKRSGHRISKIRHGRNWVLR